MHHTLTMGRDQGLGNLDGIAKSLGERKRAALQTLRQCLAFEVLHHQKIDAVFPAELIERADERVVQARYQPRLALEALLQFRRIGKMCGENFNRDGAIEPRILRLVDFTHSPLPNEAKDFEVCDVSTRFQGHRRRVISFA